MADPMNGEWEKLDQSPAASAQMIEWYAPETAKVLREREIDKIARAICDSEPFMWLMVGSNHVESQIAALREAWNAYLKAGGGYGNRARNKGAWEQPERPERRVHEEKYYGYVVTWDDVAADIWWAGREFVQSFPTPEEAKAEIDRWRRDVK